MAGHTPGDFDAAMENQQASLIEGESSPEKNENMPSTSRQYLITLISCMAPLTMGFTLGYSSPTQTELRNAGLLTSDEQGSWYGAIITLGAMGGGPLAGFLVEMLGRKTTIMACAVPYALGWELVVFSPNFYVLLAGRCVTGLAMGMSTVCVPLYLSEISTKDLRGTLGAGFQLFVTLGVLLVYALGIPLDWQWLAVAGIVLSVMLVTGMLFMPESPRWLMKNNMGNEATHALSWIRGPGVDIEDEIVDMETNLNASDSSEFHLNELREPGIYKPLIIVLGLMFFQQFSGVNAIIFYSLSIFESAGFKNGSLPEIVIGAVQVVATLLSCILMDRAGRRVLLLIAGILMTLSATTMGLFYYLSIVNNMEHLSWLSLSSLIVFIVAFSLGWGPIPWLIMGELLPGRAKGFASGLAAVLNWTCAFLVTKEFTSLESALTNYGCFWLFGGICLLSIIFVAAFLPETKGKTLEEIASQFETSPELPRLNVNE